MTSPVALAVPQEAMTGSAVKLARRIARHPPIGNIWVDIEGPQLPDLDKAVFTLAENEAILNLRAIAGEYENQLFHLWLLKVPIFSEHEKRGGYTVSLHPGDYGGDLVIECNMTYDLFLQSLASGCS